MDNRFVTTAFDFEGCKIVKNLGVVRGITVRSRSFVGNIGAGFQTLVGGNISLLEELCETSRAQAYERLIKHAEELGANAIIAMKYDANEVMAGVTEVLAYGTAVVIEAKG
ncbi:heavy metal-binding domain-containing protein [soil metagenome]